MTTLDELKDYLNITNPAGAIMVTGKWGCGKTYLIDHDLKYDDEVKDKIVIIKVSLFGIANAKELNLEVKKRWLMGRQGDLHEHPVAKSIGKVVGQAQSFIEGNWHIDVADFLTIENEIEIKTKNETIRKKVVLVFDDLERCRMNIVDILGCINDYCENQNFHTIIVANEERIHDTKAGEVSIDDLNDANTQLLYKEIKEKIILRTLYYKPNYEEIIKNIIDEIQPVIIQSKGGGEKTDLQKRDEDYKKFINENKERIAALFVKAEDIYLNNIRCIKCSLQDFSRVFHLLHDHGIRNIENWLIPFFLFEAAVRNSLIHNTEGKRAIVEIQELVHEDLGEKYFVHGIFDWIISGVWDSEKIEKEVEHYLEIEKSDSEYDKLRVGSILLLEDDLISEEIYKLLDEAYEGNLDLDDYLNLLRNIAELRESTRAIILRVDFDRLGKGVKKSINRIIKGELKDKRMIECESLDCSGLRFTLDANRIINEINFFRSGSIQEYIDSEKEYIDTIKKGITYLKNNYMVMSIKRITPKMVRVTYDEFSSCSNEEKNNFGSIFNQIFRDLRVNVNNIHNLSELRELLFALKDNYISKKKFVAGFHTNQFHEHVSELIDRKMKMLQSEMTYSEEDFLKDI